MYQPGGGSTDRSGPRARRTRPPVEQAQLGLFDDLGDDNRAPIDPAAVDPGATPLPDPLPPNTAVHVTGGAFDVVWAPVPEPGSVAPAVGVDEPGETEAPPVDGTIGPPANDPVAAVGGQPLRFAPQSPVLPPSGAKARARANIAAIEVIATLDADNRFATAAEQQVLAQWSGWGAAADIFDPRKPEWSADRDHLRSLLDDEAWGQARRNTLNAHYTDPQIAEAMWEALAAAGFQSGRVLEPGCGSGTFISYAPESAQMVGVELDATTAQVAAGLHPHAQIRNEGFQDTRVPENSFVATIGNVPFGKFRVYDPVHNQARHSIHNHFILKSLALTAPGGYVAVVTSRYTMDSSDARARREMAAQADLVGAIRLPTGAFSRVAGTDVVTDIVILRKREPNRVMSDDTRLFLRTTDVSVMGYNDVAETATINEYFHTYDRRVLGQMRHGQGVFGSTRLEVVGADDAGVVADQVRNRLSGIVATATGRGLGLTATWDTTMGPVAADFNRGLVREPAGVVSEFAVGQLRHDVQAEQIVRWNGGDWDAVPVRGAAQLAEWGALLEIRDLAVEVIEAQRSRKPTEDRSAARTALSHAYGAYVSRYGLINRYRWNEARPVTQKAHDKKLEQLTRAWRRTEHLDTTAAIPDEILSGLDDQAWENPRSGYKTWPHLGKTLRQDPTFAIVLALEEFNDETQTARKAAIFHGDILTDRRMEHQVADIDDALAATLDEGASVNLDRIGELLGIDRAEVETGLDGKAFRTLDDPDVWVPAAQYLSGNVRKKLAAAAEAADSDPRYRSNVEHLTAVMPEPVPVEAISVRPGATWIPTEDYEQFIRDTFAVPAGTRVRVEYVDAAWSVEIGPYPGMANQNMTWGVVPKASTMSPSGFNFEDADADRKGIWYAGLRRSDGGGHDYTFAAMFTDLLNSRPPEITKSKEFHEATGGDKVHDGASRAAGAKARRMGQEFEQWALFTDPERGQRLADRYNELFNSTVAPVYDGSRKRFPGLGSDFAPYPYQRNAVARICSEPTVLLDHVVGAGKTGTMLMGAMELKRLGLVSKPWIVVPNHIIDQVVRESKQWYPGAKVLAGGAATDAEGRRLLIAQSASQDWDMVIVPLSAFKRIGVDGATQAEHIRTQLEKLSDAGKGDVENKASVKRIEEATARLEEKLQDVLAALDEGKDAGLTFESSGCDYLFIDEAHMFKNLGRDSAVAELACAGSGQATDLLLKLNHLREVRQGEAAKYGIGDGAYVERVATFATGTPVANSMAEEWVMQTYLRPDLLVDAGVDHLDAWGATFTDTVTRVELNASGTKLRSVMRVGEFTNVGDLVAISAIFTDSVGRDQVPANLPEKIGGENEIVSWEPSQEVMDFIYDLGFRSEEVAKNAISPKIDNSLKVANDGRNVSLAAVIAGLDKEAEPHQRRSWQVAQRILAVHDETKDTAFVDVFGNPSPTPGGVQIVFCDRGVPKPDGSFSVYDEIRDELVAGGMDPARIRYIHNFPNDADKAKLFAQCKSGEVSVILGSTEKMGTGTNIQSRAVALHHVDAPWRPADLEQREGRIVRQGNQNRQVRVYNYVAERTFDTVMWQTVHRKAHYIEQRKTADRSLRRMPDLSADSLADNAATTKALATGDQRYLRQVELDAAVIELQGEADTHFAQQRSIERDRTNLRWQVPAAAERLARLEGALDPLHAWHSASKDHFRIVIGDTTYTDRPEASAALVEELRKTAALLKGQGMGNARPLAEIAGQAVQVRRPASTNDLWVEFTDLPVPHRAIPLAELFDSDRVTGGDRSPAARAAYNSGYMRRLATLVTDAEAALDTGRWKLSQDQTRLDQLEATTITDFPRAHELRAMVDELTELQRQLRDAEQTPEAIAAAEHRIDRMVSNGREPGWSLMLNPTPTLLEEHGLESVDDMRAVMDNRRRAAQVAARAAEDPPAIGDLLEDTRPPATGQQPGQPRSPLPPDHGHGPDRGPGMEL